MPTLKIATFNTEWMINLYKKGKAEFWEGKSGSKGIGRKPKDVPMVCQRLAGVITDIKSDIIFIQEGPPQKAQMQLFADEYLNADYDVYSMPHGTQSNHALVRKGLPLQISQVPKTHAIYRHLNKKLEYFTWGEVKKKRLENFTRDPVVLKVQHDGGVVEIMGFHTKSKISKLKKKEQYTNADRPAMVDALRSRQKLSAEMAAVRRYLTHAILSQRVDGAILVGDLNDGPHRDVFEEQFLIHSIVDELRGAFHREVALMHHALPQDQLIGKSGFTAEFSDPTQDGKIVKVLLDHVMVSPKVRSGGAPLRLRKNSGKIEHAAFEAHVEGDGSQAHHRPSDHRPVSAIFNYS
ncbi:MAG: hypothetical protein JJ911_19075 [Rhizobiaceae bacterium]|nr:hypothetical protein [Rhizobiaceae bacterium]